MRLAAAIETERVRREVHRQLDREEQPVPMLPPFETLRTRLERPAVETRYRIQLWQPADSRVLAAAQAKTGKSTLVGNLARSLVDGDPFLGRFTVQPLTGTLTILDTEMGLAQIDDWLRTQHIQRDDRIVVIPLRGQVRR